MMQRLLSTRRPSLPLPSKRATPPQLVPPQKRTHSRHIFCFLVGAGTTLGVLFALGLLHVATPAATTLAASAILLDATAALRWSSPPFAAAATVAAAPSSLSQQDVGCLPCRPCEEAEAEPTKEVPSELVPLANAQHGDMANALHMCHAARNDSTGVARKRPWMNPATHAFCTSLDGLYWAKPPVSGVREVARLEHHWRMQCAQTVKARSMGRSDLAQCRLTSVGSIWGGWHLCEKPLLDQNTSARALVYSFGLADDTSFGDHLVEKLQSEVHGFDPTRRSYRYMRRRARKRTLSPHYTFHNVGLSFFDGKAYFGDVDDLGPGGHRTGARLQTTYVFPVLSLPTLMEMNGHCWLDVLKIDIEVRAVLL